MPDIVGSGIIKKTLIDELKKHKNMSIRCGYDYEYINYKNINIYDDSNLIIKHMIYKNSSIYNEYNDILNYYNFEEYLDSHIEDCEGC